jgi:hypothetical protein
MSDLLPEGEDLRRALRWVNERLRREPDIPLARLVDDASRRFDLGPLDEEWLWRTLRKPAAKA